MIFLYDANGDESVIRQEIGCEVGILFVPSPSRGIGSTRFPIDRLSNLKFGVDNGAFSEFIKTSFEKMLERLEPYKSQCLFVAMPDVVGSARRTLEIFKHYKLPGWPIALVAQDGIEDLEIPWQEIMAIFIGGSNRFKLSDSAIHLVKAAKILGKWVHVGRVTSPERWDKFEDAGADSCDGTGLTRYSHMRIKINNRHPLFKEA